LVDQSPSDSALKACRLPAYGVHDGANILVCSNELAEMFGAGSPSEVVGRDILSFIEPGARDRVIACVLSGAPGTYKSKGLRLDGVVIPIEIASTPVRYSGREARLFTVRDLSPVALVVDDEPPVARLTAVLLRLAGYQTATYVSPRQALADYWSGGASVIVSDIMMPELDGVSLVHRLRRLDAGVPVIFVSGYTAEPVPQDSSTVFVKKPFVREHLDRALASLPERARAPIE
jgi:PAS domain S-box-containing protein